MNHRISTLLICLLTVLSAGLLWALHATGIQDPDSLRFALAVQDYDLARLQPHFPGYAAYLFPVKCLYLLTGRLYFSFFLVNAAALYLLGYSLLGIYRLLYPETGLPQGWRAQCLYILVGCGAGLILPLTGIHAGRLMPDFAGLSLLAFLVMLSIRAAARPDQGWQVAAVAGLLAGVRLSYLPAALPWLVWVFLQDRQRIRFLLAGLAAVLLWWIPLVADTGWEAFWQAGKAQATGHFYEWGGTVLAEPGWAARVRALGNGFFLHGMGLWWPGRSLWLIPLTLIWLAVPVLYRVSRWPAAGISRLPGLVPLFWSSLLLYLLWVVFFQNLLHAPRHLMPLLLPLLFLLAGIFRRLSHRWRYTTYFALAAYLMLILPRLELYPADTAIQKARPVIEAYAAASPQRCTIVSTEQMCMFLRYQGIPADFIAVESAAALRNAAIQGPRVLVIGPWKLPPQAGTRWVAQDFYHNPYLLPMWSWVHVQAKELLP